MRIVWGRPSEDPASGPALGRVSHWLDQPVAAPEPGLTVMAGARVYPGNVQTRGRTEHTGGQLLLTDDFALVPASYNLMDGRPTLPTDVDRTAPARDLDGDHFFLGSVHPHFGHVILEGLSRVWAFDAFTRAHPEGRAVIYEPWTPDFALELLDRAGVAPDRLLRSDTPLRVERLHVPDPANLAHVWTSPRQAETWQRIGRTFDRDGAGNGAGERRIYLSRRGNPARPLVEEAAVEARFAAAGFEIVRPETLPIAEQGRLARQSRVLAGCVGSQMYLSVFQRPGAHTLVLAPANFFLADDHLIARAMGHDLSVAFGGDSAYRIPQGPWSIDPAAVDALLATLEP